MQTRIALPLRWRQTFIAFKYPNFRLWFAGQVVSLFGTWMQNMAQGYLIFELTRSEAYLGYVTAAAGLPSWIFMLMGGVMADRISRRNLMVITQTSMMLLAFILAGLTFSGLVQPWHILALAFALGIANAFDAPARLSLIPELVEKEDLTNAIALNGIMFNLATITGPAMGGLVYAAFGPAWCFTINGVTFLAVIAALLLMSLPKRPPRARKASAVFEIREGLSYALHHRTVRSLLVVIGTVTLFGFSFITLMPAWAVDVLGGDATTNGLLRSAQGVGALAGALLLASLSRFNRRGWLLSIGSLLFPILLIVFSRVTALPFSLLAVALAGSTVILVNNVSNSLIQDSVGDDLRGRVSSIFTLTFFGAMPVGSVLIGWLAELAGPQTAVLIGGLALLVCSGLVWWLAPYVRKLE